MPILFLDFDGVLHPEHCHESKHFCCLPVLEDALRQAPEWQVVIIDPAGIIHEAA